MEKHKSFQKLSFYYTPTRSVSLLTSVLNFQTSITDGRRPRMSRYFCLLCIWLRGISWQWKDFDYSWSLGYNWPITSCRRNERCQRPKTSWFDFVFPFAFKNKHQFENFFVHNGRYWYSVTFWIWAVSELSRRHVNHKPQRFDFLIECKKNDGTCQFYCSHNENIQFTT